MYVPTPPMHVNRGSWSITTIILHCINMEYGEEGNRVGVFVELCLEGV